MFTKLFNQITKHDAASAGGKGASLGEMTQAGIPVPPGFVLLADSFEQFLKETDLNVEIDSILHTVNHQEMHTVEHASEKIQKLILEAKMPEDIASEIESECAKLGAEFVAVRSSATAEDGAENAWAGQLDSFLNTNEETLLENVKKCWASLFTPRAVFYRFEKGLHDQKISVAVVVQKMVASEKSGIAFSVHPVTEDRNQLIIEAGFGLGEAIVSGQITPDSYVVEKNTEMETFADNSAFEQLPEKEEREFLHFSLPMFPITSYFFGGVSPKLKYKDDYLIGNWYIKYRFEGNSEAIFPKSSLVNYGKRFIELLEKRDSEFIETLFQKYSAIIELADVLQEVSYQEVFNKKVPEKHEFYSIYAELFPWVAGVGYSIDTALEVYVREKNIELHGIQILGESFITQEERELQKVAHIEDEAERSKKMEEHAARYSFLLSNYKGYHPIGISYFSDRLHEVKNKDFPEKIKEIKKPETLQEWIGFSTYIRDERKRCNMLFSAIYSRYIQRECEKYGVPYEQAVMLTPLEFEEQKKSGSLRDYAGERLIKTSHEGGFVDVTVQEWEALSSRAFTNGISGTTASKGFASGRVRIVLHTEDFKKVQDGDVIVASMTRPEFAPILKKASAIITNEGGVTCHAAIISRELHIPCIIGTQNATRVLHDGDLVEVDADNGVVRILK